MKAFPLTEERVAVTFDNVTEIVRSRRALQESEARFRGAFDAASVGMTLTGLDGTFIQVNERFAQMLGYSVDELMRLGVRGVTHPDDIAIDLQYGAEMLEGHARVVHAREALPAPGRIRHVGRPHRLAHPRLRRRAGARRRARARRDRPERGEPPVRVDVRALRRAEADRGRRAADRRPERLGRRAARCLARGGTRAPPGRAAPRRIGRRPVGRLPALGHARVRGDAAAAGRRAAADRVRGDGERPPRPSHRRRARPVAPEGARGAAAPGAEDGGGRPPRRRHRPRLQQPAHRDLRLQRVPVRGHRGRAAAASRRGDQEGGGARRGAHRASCSRSAGGRSSSRACST